MKNKFLNALKSQEYFENFITRSVRESNSIEGSTLSYAETYAIVFNDNSLPLNNVKPRELYEAINLKYALDYSLNNLDKFDLNFISHIGDIINKNIKDTSGFRKVQNYIRGADFVPPKPEYIPSRMNELLFEYAQEDSELDTIQKIAKFHIDFEHLHPFEDGNGRTGRIIINHQLLMKNEMPIVLPEEKRTEYFDMLQKYDIDGLANMIRELQEKEISKMKEYQVDKSKEDIEM